MAFPCNPRLNGGEWKRICAAVPIADRMLLMPTLFDPLKLGSLELPNRIVMAPLTRARAGCEAIPNAIDGRILCAARRRRADHLRGDRDQPRRSRLAECAGPVERCAGRRMEAGDRRRARCRRAGSSPSCGTWVGWCIPTLAAVSRYRHRRPRRPISPTPTKARSPTSKRARRRTTDIRAHHPGLCPRRPQRDRRRASTASSSMAPMAI